MSKIGTILTLVDFYERKITLEEEIRGLEKKKEVYMIKRLVKNALSFIYVTPYDYMLDTMIDKLKKLSNEIDDFNIRAEKTFTKESWEKLKKEAMTKAKTRLEEYGE